jgi:hypothetical protein
MVLVMNSMMVIVFIDQAYGHLWHKERAKYCCFRSPADGALDRASACGRQVHQRRPEAHRLRHDPGHGGGRGAVRGRAYAVAYTAEQYFEQDGQISKAALKATFKEQYRQARQRMKESPPGTGS